MRVPAYCYIAFYAIGMLRASPTNLSPSLNQSSQSNRLEWEYEIAATWQHMRDVYPRETPRLVLLGILFEDVDGLTAAGVESAIVTITASHVVDHHVYQAAHFNTEGFRNEDYEVASTSWERHHALFDWPSLYPGREPPLTLAGVLDLIHPLAQASGHDEPLACILSRLFATQPSDTPEIQYLCRYHLHNDIPAHGSFAVSVNVRTREVFGHDQLPLQHEETWAIEFQSAKTVGNITQSRSAGDTGNASIVFNR